MIPMEEDAGEVEDEDGELELCVRQYPWGTCRPMDPKHSDLKKVMDWLKRRVDEVRVSYIYISCNTN